MAATGFTPIQLYRTSTAAAVPTSGNLADGELAINTTDERLYFKNAAGTVKLLASNSGALGDVTTTGTQTLTNKTVVAPVVLASTTATQDGVIVTGRAGGSTSLRVTVAPTTLTASRAQTLPDAAGTFVLDSAPQYLSNKILGNPDLDPSPSGTTLGRLGFDTSGNFSYGDGVQRIVVNTTKAQTLTNKTISADDNTLSGIAASSFVLSNASGNIDGSAAQKAIPSGVVVGTTDTQTLTNKRVTPRSVDIASATTITPTGDTADQYEVTALAAGATIAAPSGTPTDGQKLVLRIKDNGTARALTWTTTSGAYRAVGVTLPTTTVISKVVYIGCVYNAQDSFWDVLAVAQLA